MSGQFSWMPLGPSTLIRGSGNESQPRVSGRVRDIAVNPKGTRAYAATAGGGVWYTNNTGKTWSPIGNWLPVPATPQIISPASPLSCGCLFVDFGTDQDDGSTDDVYVGTGEIVPDYNRGFPGGRLGGVGVLHLTGHLADALANPFANPWKREAPNLTGFGIFRLARDPRTKTSMVAATSDGLFFRAGAFVEDAPWARIVAKSDTSIFNMITTDVVWLPSGRLWVTDMSPDTFVLRFSDPAVNTKPTFDDTSKVELAASLRGSTDPRRLTIGVHPNRIYVLGSGPRLWRTAPAGTPPKSINPIQPIPDQLFTTPDGDQSAYDAAVAVHPDHEDVVTLGGAGREIDGGEYASLFRFRISGAENNLQTDFIAGDESTYLGRGIHPDVHQIVYAGPDRSMWVACDGGVYRSAASGDSQTFLSLNTGLPALESGFVSNNPVSDACVISGGQDNGITLRVGDTVWQSVASSGDGGGVVFHPSAITHFFFQTKQADWSEIGNLIPPPVDRPGVRSSSEQNRALAYSNADVRQTGAQVRLAFGTNRVWLLDDWKITGKNSWVTLPGAKDPLVDASGQPHRDTKTDVYANGSGQIVACRWMNDNRLIVLVLSTHANGHDSAVLLLEQKTDKTWERTELSSGDIDTTIFPNLPPLGGWSDIGIHDPNRNRVGSFYVAITGHTGIIHRKLDNDPFFQNDLLTNSFVGNLYWFDGNKRWIPTSFTLANNPPNDVGSRAPALSVVCDRDDPNTIVYVGTSIGVWQGTLTFSGDNPSWTWKPFSNNLPPAAVHDLAIYRRGSLKLLRAATQSRGIWEVDLANPTPTPQLFLRVHPTDSRRQLPTPLDNPLSGPDPWVWFASPDIRLRPAPGQAAPPVPASLTAADPWTRNIEIPEFDLWTFQTALRKQDARVRPTGQWTLQFTSCVEKLHNTAPKDTITPQIWTTVVTQANAFAEPWDGEPSEADLLEFIIEEHAREESAGILAGPARRMIVRPRKYRIDVLVHYRDLTPLPANQVKVTLLFLPQTLKKPPKTPLLTPPVPQPTTIPATFAADIAKLITGATTTPPAPWKAADKDHPVHSPTAAIDVTTPRVVTFEMDFTTLDAGAYALLAIAHQSPAQGADSGPTLSGTTLEQVVLNNPGAAVRIVNLIKPKS